MIVLSRWMEDWFSYCHSNPIFCEQLLDLPVRQYHYGGREASPSNTGDLQTMLPYTKYWGAEEPRKTSHIHRNRLVMLDVALIHMNIWVQVSVSIRNWVCKCVDKLQVATDTFCHPSVNFLWNTSICFIWVWQVMSLTISDLHYLQRLVPDNCGRKLLSALGEIANLEVIWYDQWIEESS